MAHLSAIAAAMFSDFAVAAPITDLTPAALDALDTEQEFMDLFATEISSQGGTKAAGTFVRIKNVREIPQLGEAPNIVNVPTFGQRTSDSIQGQSDAPSLELQLNFVPAEWAPTTILGAMRGVGVSRVYRVAMLANEPDGDASTSLGLGSVLNSQMFFVGKMEALQYQPQLTDSTLATLTLSIQSDQFGLYTNT